MWFTSDNAGAGGAGGAGGCGAGERGERPVLRRRGGDGAGDGAAPRIFEAPEAAVYLVATGTAANALALACLCPPWATVYCHATPM